ncbi:fimbria/pilus periplasmic chaperone [Serratia ureilytica]|uniref:fimbria/pilus periplasmic chaperone n=1 Tax=Serratia ureilytica TaxID=300181 RepID=UPI003F6CE585
MRKILFIDSRVEMKSKYLIIPFLVATLPLHSYAKFEGDVLTKEFSVKIGGSRVIYNEGSSSEVVLLINPQNYPILVESKVFSEDKKNQDDFIVTPPLIRLGANQQSRVRIIKTKKSEGLKHETLQWVCFNAIPPKNSNENSDERQKRALIDVNLTINTCNKLIFRPGNLKGTVESEAEKLQWGIKNGVLTANNPTPFYMSIGSIYFGGKVLKGNGYIPPFESKSFKTVKNKEAKIQWDVINDFGGVSKKYTSKINN